MKRNRVTNNEGITNVYKKIKNKLIIRKKTREGEEKPEKNEGNHSQKVRNIRRKHDSEKDAAFMRKKKEKGKKEEDQRKNHIGARDV